jgi:hypothetical protein
MHSARDLTSDMFSLTVSGQAATLDDIFPGFQAQDRLGVVVRRPGGALGSSALIMAAITGFYDIQRASGHDFFIYPDYFLFHVGQRHGDHNMLDIWPDHKEVVVQDDPELILQAINDRGITRLLVEDGDPGFADAKRHTRESAESRIATLLAYAPGGRVQGGDVEVVGNSATESYVNAVIEKSPMLSDDARATLRADRTVLLFDGKPVETYRRMDVLSLFH